MGLGTTNTAHSGSGSGAASRLFAKNILNLKLLRIFFLALVSNHTLFKRNIFFQQVTYLYLYSLILQLTEFIFLLKSSSDNYLSRVYLLEKTY